MNLPSWAVQAATTQDRKRFVDALPGDRATVTWPEERALRAWARAQGWPAPWFGFQKAFLAEMTKDDAHFALALDGSGIRISLPVARYVLPDSELRELDELYDARSPDNRPTEWGALVEALREIRRAIEQGVEVEIEGVSFRDPWVYYGWVHARYHMLEDGYDKWVMDDN